MIPDAQFMEYLKITKATNVTLYKRGHYYQGDLHLTTHHLIFTYCDKKTPSRELWLSYPIIDNVELRSGSCLLDILHVANGFNCGLLDDSAGSNDTIAVVQSLRDIANLYRGACLKIKCKDFLNLSIDFSDQKLAKDVFDSIKKLTCLTAITQLYGFLYNPIPIEKAFNSWNIYDSDAEFVRQGMSDKWRTTSINATYQLCDTYPKKLIVPQLISDNVLKYAAKFRSKNRIPVLTYFYKKNGCTITRASQPLTGLSQSRSVQDEKLIYEIFQSNSHVPDSSNLRSEKEFGRYNNLIVDARPTANAMAQTALGAGTEIIDNYKHCKRKFLGIDNIHVMRDSLNKVNDILKDSDLLVQLPGLNASNLIKTNWLKNVSIVMNGVDLVVKTLHLNNSHCMVHCSDGWDRTTQVCSLAQICLDPYFRTLEGFIVLVEKDWFSFGHRFKERSGHLSSETKFINYSNKKSNEEVEEQDETSSSLFEDGFSLNADSILNSDPINSASKSFNKLTNHFKKKKHVKFTSPIFQQFLDCVYQILIQFPTKFEFNERFLRRLVYHLYSCQYGNFLVDSEHEKFTKNIETKTRSVWDYFLARRKEFTNETFENDEVLLPNCENVKWWFQLYGRTNEEMNGLSLEKSRPDHSKSIRETNLSILKSEKMNDSGEMGSESIVNKLENMDILG